MIRLVVLIVVVLDIVSVLMIACVHIYFHRFARIYIYHLRRSICEPWISVRAISVNLAMMMMMMMMV